MGLSEGAVSLKVEKRKTASMKLVRPTAQVNFHQLRRLGLGRTCGKEKKKKEKKNKKKKKKKKTKKKKERKSKSPAHIGRS